MIKKIVFVLAAFASLISAQAQNCDELFISEYVEGSRNNKALEIYNPTGSAIDLSKYRITRWQNGSAQWTAQYSDSLKGTLESHDVIVCVLDRRDTTKTGQDTPVVLPLRLKADLFLSANYNVSYAMSFNGDDAVSLDKYNDATGKWVPVDIFGKIGERPSPAWSDKAPFTGTGTWYSLDKTLIRKDSVVGGVKKNPSIFNPSVEWELNPRDMFDSLGFHYCMCGWPAKTLEMPKMNEVSLYPNPAIDLVTSFLGFVPSKVQILGVDGRELKIENAIRNDRNSSGFVIWEAQVGTLSSGTYMVVFTAPNGQKSVARLMK